MSPPIFQDAQFDALRNALYHTSRGRFLDALNRFFNFLIIVLGAAAVGKFAEKVAFDDLWVELGIVFFATIQLVLDFGGRSCTHLFLQKRYYELLAEIESSTLPDNDDTGRMWSSKMLAIAADEPLPMRALDAIAYNSALDARTSDPEILQAHRLYVPLSKRLLKQFVAFQGTQFQPRSQRNGIWVRIKKWFGT